ncbi:hypothetical protein [Neolewinella sp.]|uniref:hypothetical protein n=1 Tax=Neolewinella sp. TaxID=2993543 RepID=UPI003B522C1E
MQRTFFLFLLASFSLHAQSDMTGIELEGATALQLSALFSSVDIREATGDAITIEHSVIVEGEPRPELAKLDVKRGNGTIYVEETGPTMQQLNRQSRRENCCDDQIRMIVRVPAGITVTVETEYGVVDIADLAGLVAVNSTYGGVTVVYDQASLSQDLDLYSNYGAVDLTLPQGQGARVELTTEFGELLTDLDIAIDEAASEKRDYYERVVGTIGGGGAQVRCKAPYGKVYLRGSD